MKYNLVKKLGVGSAGDAYLLDNGKAYIAFENGVITEEEVTELLENVFE